MLGIVWLKKEKGRCTFNHYYCELNKLPLGLESQFFFACDLNLESESEDCDLLSLFPLFFVAFKLEFPALEFELSDDDNDDDD